MLNGLLESMLSLFPTVAFAAAFITAFVEGIKRLGWLPDGWAGLVALALNAVFWLAQYIAGQAGYVAELETLVGAGAAVLPILFALIGSGVSVGAFELLRGR